MTTPRRPCGRGRVGKEPAVAQDAPIRTLLAAARLPASEPEVTAFAADYAIQRIQVDALYEVEAARDIDPALRFRASARILPWA